ncbi:MAG: hypothetical protein Q7S65_02775, partial [Nanoarchaeota archaeon]|nr:hypothetical protein [Nanoarchaeota archaeon]
GGLVLLLSSYLSPSAVLGYLASRNFGGAFSFSTVFRKAFTGAYFAAWFVSILLSIALGLVFAAIPLVGGAVAGFVIGVFTYTLIGEAYASIK